MTNIPQLPGAHAWRDGQGRPLPIEFYKFFRDLALRQDLPADVSAQVANLLTRVEALEAESDALIHPDSPITVTGTLAGGLVVVGLEDKTPTAGGTLQKYGFDSKGLRTEEDVATTDDLPEGATNLYFTDERAQDAVGTILADSAEIAFTYDDGVPSISASIVAGSINETKLDAGVNASLALADSSLQPGDNVSELTNDAGYVDAAGASTAAPVQSVNGETGAVILDATDVGADAAGTAAASIAAHLAAPDPHPQYLTAAEGDAAYDIAGAASAAESSANSYTDASLLNYTPTSGLGSAAFEDVGTSGGTVPLLNGMNTWSAAQAISFSGTNNPLSISGSLTGNGRFIRFQNTDTSTANSAFVQFISGGSSITGQLIAFGSEYTVIPAYAGKVGLECVVGGGVIYGAAVTNGTHAWYTGTGRTLRLTLSTVGNITPGSDNSQNVGSAALRWSVVYAGTGTINTSDAREKTAVTQLTENELACASALAKEIGWFKWLNAIEAKGEEAARRHVGFTVQRAIEIMQQHGLDPFAWGFICYDEWPETTEPAEYEDALGEDGLPTGEQTLVREVVVHPAGNRYSLRNDELLKFIARGQEQRLSAIEARLGL